MQYELSQARVRSEPKIKLVGDFIKCIKTFAIGYSGLFVFLSGYFRLAFYIWLCNPVQKWIRAACQGNDHSDTISCGTAA